MKSYRKEVGMSKRRIVFFSILFCLIIIVVLYFVINTPLKRLIDGADYHGPKDAEVKIIEIGNYNDNSSLEMHNLVKNISNEYPINYAFFVYIPDEDYFYGEVVGCASYFEKGEEFYEFVLSGLPTGGEVFSKVKEYNLNPALFQECLDGDIYKGKVKQQNNLIRGANLDAPSLVVNGEKYSWPMGRGTLKLLVEENS